MQEADAPPVGSEIGMRAPAFALLDQNGETVSLSDYRGKTLAIVFYRGHW